MNEQEKLAEAVTENENKPFFYAGFWLRFWAYLIDLLVVGSINRLVVYPIFTLLGLTTNHSPFAAYSIITSLTLYVYFVLMTKYFGQTLGKMVFGLKVVTIYGEPLSWGAALFRESIGRFISQTVLFIGYIFVAFTAKKQGWHDKIADTYVVADRADVLVHFQNKNTVKDI